MANKVEKPDKQEVAIQSLVEVMAYADMFVKSGMFKDIKSQAQAGVKILAGKELGFAPMESMQNLYMTEKGKLGAQAKIVGALVKKSLKYDYRVERIDNEGCIIIFFIIELGKKIELGKSSFLSADAAKAGLINKDNYKSFPRNMYFSRALMNGVRWYCPDVFCGYAIEEIETPENVTSIVTIDEKGDVKENGEKRV